MTENVIFIGSLQGTEMANSKKEIERFEEVMDQIPHTIKDDIWGKNKTN